MIQQDEYFVTYPDSQERLLLNFDEDEVTEETKKEYRKFDFFVMLTHLIGIVMLALNGRNFFQEKI